MAPGCLLVEVLHVLLRGSPVVEDTLGRTHLSAGLGTAQHFPDKLTEMVEEGEI